MCVRVCACVWMCADVCVITSVGYKGNYIFI